MMLDKYRSQDGNGNGIGREIKVKLQLCETPLN
jgi:hypothetical protein